MEQSFFREHCKLQTAQEIKVLLVAFLFSEIMRFSEESLKNLYYIVEALMPKATSGI